MGRGSAGAELQRIDKSFSVAGTSSVRGAFVLPASKGREEVILVTNPDQFLQEYTPTGEKVEVGLSTMYYEIEAFLKKAPAYIKRVHNRAKHGASIVKSYTVPISNTFNGKFVYSGSNNAFSVSSFTGKKLKTGSVVQTATDDTLPTGLTVSTYYFVIKLTDTTFQLASSYEDAIAGTPIAITGAGTGNHTLNIYENLIVSTFTSDFVTDENTFTIPLALGRSLQTGQVVLVNTKGTISTGLTNLTQYYVIKLSDTQIKFATSKVNADDNISIAITGAGTGTFYIFTPTNHKISLISTFTIDVTNDYIVVPEWLGSFISTGDDLLLGTDNDLSGTGITANETYYAVKVSNTEFKLSTTKENALLGIPVTIDLLTIGTGLHFVEKQDGGSSFSGYIHGSNEVMLVYPRDKGSFSKDGNSGNIRYAIVDNRAVEPDSFFIRTYKTTDLVNHVEEKLCSRKQITDLAGNLLYVEEVMKTSQYLRVEDNIAISEDVFPLTNSTPVGFDGGDNGDPVTDAEMVQALSVFANRDLYDINLIMDGGWSTPVFARAINETILARKDVFGAISTPITVENLCKDAEGNTNNVQPLLDYRSSLNLDTSYMGLFTSHQKISDKYNGGREIYISPTGFIGAIIANNASEEEFWEAPANFRKAKYDVIESNLVFDKPLRDILYDNQINPSRYKRNRGVANYGNKTLQVRHSATDRINVSLMLIQVEPAVLDAFEENTFENNDTGLRNDVFTEANEFMEKIQARGGVYDFIVICDSTNNTDGDIDEHNLTLDIGVQPTKTAEFLKLRFTIARTGVSFQGIIGTV